jgi:peptidoglycan L-alanyl-D-glutamate endopeptidase CwlK
MSFSLSSRSLQKLEGVHPDLVKVVLEAITISDVDFRVTEGLRTLKRQKELFKAGATKTLNSRHLGPVSHAVDLVALVGLEVRWDWPLYDEIAKSMKAAAKALRVPIEWGGDWKTFKDGPHFQLPWREYP